MPTIFDRGCIRDIGIMFVLRNHFSKCMWRSCQRNLLANLTQNIKKGASLKTETYLSACCDLYSRFVFLLTFRYGKIRKIERSDFLHSALCLVLFIHFSTFLENYFFSFFRHTNYYLQEFSIEVFWCLNKLLFNKISSRCFNETSGRDREREECVNPYPLLSEEKKHFYRPVTRLGRTQAFRTISALFRTGNT